MTRTFFRYYGGKFRLAPWIMKHFPEHQTYVEGFAGAASVFFRKKRSYAEVLNDRSSEIINVFRVMQDDAKREKLCQLLDFTPYARVEYDKACIPEKDIDDVERARRLLIRSFMSHNADCVNPANAKSGFRNGVKRDYSIAAHDWASYPKAIQAFAERLQGIIIENLDVFELFGKFDAEDTLWYLDPPYLGRSQPKRHAYFKEFDDDDHYHLIERILKLKGKVILSGYQNILYQALEMNGWRREDKVYYGKQESLWLNFQE